jgi:NDP-sugar pyrophosphorylase family protein
MGTPERYLAGVMKLLEMPFAGRLEITPHDPVQSIGACQVAHGPGATLDADLQLEGGVVVELASRVGRESRIRNSVVMAGAWIGPGSDLDRAIIGPGVEIPAGFEGRGCLVGLARGRRPVSDGPDLRLEGDLLIYDFSADHLVGS